MIAQEFSANWPFVAMVALGVVALVWVVMHKVKVELGPLKMAAADTAHQIEAVATQVNHVEEGDPTMRAIIIDIKEQLKVITAVQTVQGQQLTTVVERVSVLERLDSNTQTMFEEFQHQLDDTQVAAARAALLAKEAMGVPAVPKKEPAERATPAARATPRKKAS